MKRIITTLFAFVLTLPLGASAATLVLNANPEHFGVGDVVEVTASVDSSTAVNAFSGSLSYPGEMLELVATGDGNSIVSAWIERPAAAGAGVLEFAGVTPGGYLGRSGKLFSAQFKALRAGSARISASGVQILRADGEGTAEHVDTPSLNLSIGGQASGGFVQAKDVDAPEPFDIALGSDSNIFNGKPYVVFAAVDKNSGVNHYEVAETRFPAWLFAPKWNKTDSPYALSDTYFTSDVTVRAIDGAGNIRESVFHREHYVRTYEWFVCGILIVLLYFVRRRLVS